MTGAVNWTTELRLLASERDFQNAVLGWLDFYNWKYFHDNDSRTNRAGLPDVIATNGRVLLLAELKSMKGRIRPEQQEWEDALGSVTRIVSGIYRPDRAEELYDIIRTGKGER